MNRKNFIQEAGRWTILGIIAGLVALIVGKRELTLGASCPEGEFCKGCSKFGSCDLPQAKEQE
jgi:hypothetical protein